MSSLRERQGADRERIIQYLLEHGETVAPNINIPGMNTRSINGICGRMAEDGILSRRPIDYKDRVAWGYSVTGKVPKEPEHIYILRNLPSFPLSEEACQ